MTAKTPVSRPAPMTAKAAARIQSRTAKSHGGRVAKSDFASRALRAAAKNGKP